MLSYFETKSSTCYVHPYASYLYRWRWWCVGAASSLPVKCSLSLQPVLMMWLQDPVLPPLAVVCHLQPTVFRMETVQLMLCCYSSPLLSPLFVKEAKVTVMLGRRQLSICIAPFLRNFVSVLHVDSLLPLSLLALSLCWHWSTYVWLMCEYIGTFINSS